MKNRNYELEGTIAILQLSKSIVFLSFLTIICSLLFLFFIFFPPNNLLVLKNGGEKETNNDHALSSLNLSGTQPNHGTISNSMVNEEKTDEKLWSAPDSLNIPQGELGKMVRYGKELVMHTSKYWGPKGSIDHISNGMNCQNCHLEAGTRPFGNNFAVFFNSYPKIILRSGNLSPASQRIVECMERSLGGKSPDTNKKEVKAILAYMAWIGKDVPRGKKIKGSGSEKLPYLDKPANIDLGKIVYGAKCQRCHGIQGQGLLSSSGREYTSPPVWGEHSFNDGAGMYRISNLAGFIKNNMPFGATYKSPLLSNEEAWNVAAYIASKERPHYNQDKDWKVLRNKPIDLPFGPYLDPFPESQHKFGPFKPIIAYLEKKYPILKP